MTRSPKSPPTTQATLTRFTLATIVLVWLTISCFRTVDPDLRVLVGILAFAVFLATLLFGIDAGKAINREPTANPRLRFMGTVLVLPLAVFGVIFIGAGLVLLFVSARTIETAA